jgi:hypothetical protein
MKSGDEEQAEHRAVGPRDSKADLSTRCACGKAARRADARFCAECGSSLSNTYLPADALLASYSQKRRRLVSAGNGLTKRTPAKQFVSSIVSTSNRNGASTTALAFVTYALVPYLGILFCPGALLMGGVGIYSSYRLPERGGRRASYLSVVLGLLLFCAQLFLWWILYKIPEWSNKP